MTERAYHIIAVLIVLAGCAITFGAGFIAGMLIGG